MTHPFVFATAIALGLAGPASAFTGDNGFTVRATDSQNFVVDFNGGQGESGYWCAAAQYVAYGLGQSQRTRLFRATPVPRKIGQGVGFTLDPAKATADNGLSLFGSKDGTVSVGHAINAFCRLFRPFNRS